MMRLCIPLLIITHLLNETSIEAKGYGRREESRRPRTDNSPSAYIVRSEDLRRSDSDYYHNKYDGKSARPRRSGGYNDKRRSISNKYSRPMREYEEDKEENDRDKYTYTAYNKAPPQSIVIITLPTNHKPSYHEPTYNQEMPQKYESATGYQQPNAISYEQQYYTPPSQKTYSNMMPQSYMQPKMSYQPYTSQSYAPNSYYYQQPIMQSYAATPSYTPYTQPSAMTYNVMTSSPTQASNTLTRATPDFDYVDDDDEDIMSMPPGSSTGGGNAAFQPPSNTLLTRAGGNALPNPMFSNFATRLGNSFAPAASALMNTKMKTNFFSGK